MPRAPVEIDGRATHLDEVLGDGFALVARAGAPHGGQPLVRLRRLGEARIDRAVVDRDGVLSAWLSELGAEAALVRPDRVVMASGRLAAAPRWIEALCRQCGWEGA